MQTLKTLEERWIKGQILTTDYLEFSDPKALRKLAELNNIELKMYMTEESGEGFILKDIYLKIKIYIELLQEVPIWRKKHYQ